MAAFLDPLLPASLLAQSQANELPRLPAIKAIPKECRGLSGLKFRQYVQYLVKNLNEGSYLEVGIFKGYTILNTAVRTRTPHIAVDDFSQFDKDGQNKAIFLKGAEGLDHISLFDMHYEDYFASLDNNKRDVGVYFFDATHDYRSQFMGIALATKTLLPGAIVLVDDANYHHVRYACYDLLKVYPSLKLLGEMYTPCHPMQMTSDQKHDALRGWWNGCIVMQYDPDGLLPSTCLTPQTSNDYRNMVTNALHKGRCSAVTDGLSTNIYTP